MKDAARLDYMDDPIFAENIAQGTDDDGNVGYLRNLLGGEVLWYPTLRYAIDAAMEDERLKAENDSIGEEMLDAGAL